MKRINIVQYSRPDMDSVYLKDRLYNVFIGERRVYFGSEIHAKRFLNDSNRLLNTVLHSCNYLYYNLFSEYRKIWFLTDNKKLYNNSEEIISNAFLSIDKSFNWLVNRSSTSMNGNANAFSFSEKILREMLLISNHLVQVLIDKSRNSDKQIIDFYINQIHSLLKQLNNWGKGMNEKFEFIKED